MLTPEKLLAGLDEIVLRLANDTARPPRGWTRQQWAYVLGIASAQIVLFSDRWRQGPEDPS